MLAVQSSCIYLPRILQMSTDELPNSDGDQAVQVRQVRASEFLRRRSRRGTFACFTIFIVAASAAKKDMTAKKRLRSPRKKATQGSPYLHQRNGPHKAFVPTACLYQQLIGESPAARFATSTQLRLHQ